MLILSVTIAFLLLGVLWLAAVLHEHGLKPMRRMAELMKRPAAEIALVAFVAIGMIHHGATKGTNGVNGAGGGLDGGTNGVQSMGGFLTGLMGLTGFGDGGIALPSLDLQPSTLNLLPPTTNSDWLAFGGYEDWFYLDGGGWCFRFGSNLVERLTVFSCGAISPAPYDGSNRISLLGLPLAILPAANWHLLGDGGWGMGNGEQGTGNCQLPTTNYQLKSLFCHEETPSNTLLLTWRNALVNRDTDLPVTVQAELFPDGAAAFRYDFSGIGDVSALSNAETQIWRDGVLATNGITGGGQGLPALPEMLVVGFDAPPITGTNLIGEVYARIAGGNSNAYYCADVVVEKGPAKIRVEPLGVETNQGLLGTYEIVAIPGETNRLPLLIGPKYTVTAESAFGSFELVPPPFVPLADDTGTIERLSFGDAFSATNVTDRLVEVQWPVEFALEEIDATPEATTYALRVTPDWLDGVVTWHGIADTNAPPMRGAPPMRSVGDSCSCGCLVRDGLDLIHFETCSCEHCPAEGECSYEGHSENDSIDVKASSNGGEPQGPGGDGGNDPPPPDEPSVTLSFDKSYVIFEPGYEDSFGEWVSSNSTTAKLTVTAYGGPNGISIFYQPNGVTVKPDSGELPTSVAAHQTVQREVYVEGVSASVDIGASSYAAVYTDNETFNTYVAVRDITSVRVELEPTIQRNGRPNRHTVGVCEIVECQHYPPTAPVVWSVNSSSGAVISNDNQNTFLVAPLISANVNLLANCGDANYFPQVTIQEPSGLWCSNNVVIITNAIPPNEFGGIGMALTLYVLPMEVSFENIAVEEVPCTQGTHSGFFTNLNFSAFWSHTYDMGAGRWINVQVNNKYGVDTSRFRTWPMPWSVGEMTWKIPIGWNAKGTTTGEQIRNFHDGYQSKWKIMGDGAISKSKHGYTVIKDANGQVRKEGPNNGN